MPTADLELILKLKKAEDEASAFQKKIAETLAASTGEAASKYEAFAKRAASQIEQMGDVQEKAFSTKQIGLFFETGKRGFDTLAGPLLGLSKDTQKLADTLLDGAKNMVQLAVSAGPLGALAGGISVLVEGIAGLAEAADNAAQRLEDDHKAVEKLILEKGSIEALTDAIDKHEKKLKELAGEGGSSVGKALAAIWDAPKEAAKEHKKEVEQTLEDTYALLTEKTQREREILEEAGREIVESDKKQAAEAARTAKEAADEARRHNQEVYQDAIRHIELMDELHAQERERRQRDRQADQADRKTMDDLAKEAQDFADKISRDLDEIEGHAFRGAFALGKGFDAVFSNAQKEILELKGAAEGFAKDLGGSLLGALTRTAEIAGEAFGKGAKGLQEQRKAQAELKAEVLKGLAQQFQSLAMGQLAKGVADVFEAPPKVPFDLASAALFEAAAMATGYAAGRASSAAAAVGGGGGAGTASGAPSRVEAAAQGPQTPSNIYLGGGPGSINLYAGSSERSAAAAYSEIQRWKDAHERQGGRV